MFTFHNVCLCVYVPLHLQWNTSLRRFSLPTTLLSPQKSSSLNYSTGRISSSPCPTPFFLVVVSGWLCVILFFRLDHFYKSGTVAIWQATISLLVRLLTGLKWVVHCTCRGWAVVTFDISLRCAITDLTTFYYYTVYQHTIPDHHFHMLVIQYMNIYPVHVYTCVANAKGIENVLGNRKTNLDVCKWTVVHG